MKTFDKAEHHDGQDKLHGHGDSGVQLTGLTGGEAQLRQAWRQSHQMPKLIADL
jgi:hypothetical protein